MTITLTIPRAALAVMASKTPSAAYLELTDRGRLPLLELMTFGMFNFPISEGATFDADRVVAYVSTWEAGYTTLCAVAGNDARLVHSAANVAIMDPVDALEFFKAHRPEGGVNHDRQ